MVAHGDARACGRRQDTVRARRGRHPAQYARFPGLEVLKLGSKHAAVGGGALLGYDLLNLDLVFVVLLRDILDTIGVDLVFTNKVIEFFKSFPGQFQVLIGPGHRAAGECHRDFFSGYLKYVESVTRMELDRKSTRLNSSHVSI